MGRVDEFVDDQVWIVPERSISRRDWFAGLAMQGMLTRFGKGDFRDEWIAEAAESRADELIARLDAKKEGGV